MLHLLIYREKLDLNSYYHRMIHRVISGLPQSPIIPRKSTKNPRTTSVISKIINNGYLQYFLLNVSKSVVVSEQLAFFNRPTWN